jgi:hypothetical protein
MYFDASLLGESLDELTARLDARDALTSWASIAPALGQAGDVAELVTLLAPDEHSTRRAAGARLDSWDELLCGLLQVAAADGGDDQDAVLLAVYMVAPGAARLVRRGFDVGLVLGELTIQIRTYPWQSRTRAVAANLLLDTEHGLCRETRPLRLRSRSGPHSAKQVTEIVTGIGAGDPLVDFLLVTDQHEDDLDLVDLLLWAERTGVVDARDLSMLVEYYYAREFTGAGHEHVAKVFGVTERTSKRRCTAALSALQAAAPQYLAA